MKGCLPRRGKHSQDAGRHALTDADRSGWLDTLARLLDSAIATPGPGVVLTCSALKRNTVTACAMPARAVRWASSSWTWGHFFSPDLVANQFTTLEAPRQERRVLTSRHR
jgi:gluconokinase